MTTNPAPSPLDPHDLVAKGVALATVPELAKRLGLSRGVLESLLHGDLAGRVRFVRTPPGGGKWLYAVEDAKAAIAPLLPALEEARTRRAELQAKDEADAEKRKAERQAAHAAHVARKQARGQRSKPTSPTPPIAPTLGKGGMAGAASSPPTSSGRHPRTPPSPEVFVRRKFSGGDL